MPGTLFSFLHLSQFNLHIFKNVALILDGNWKHLGPAVKNSNFHTSKLARIKLPLPLSINSLLCQCKSHIDVCQFLSCIAKYQVKGQDWDILRSSTVYVVWYMRYLQRFHQNNMCVVMPQDSKLGTLYICEQHNESTIIGVVPSTTSQCTFYFPSLASSRPCRW